MYIFCADWGSPSSVWPYTYSFLCLSQFPAQRPHWTLYRSSYLHPTFSTHLSCQNQNQPIAARNKRRWRRRTRMRYLLWRFLWLTSRYKKQLVSPPSHLQGKSTRYHLVRLPWRWFWPTKFCCIQSRRFVHFPSGPFCISFWFISRVMVQPPEGGSYWHAKIIELRSNGQSDNLMVTDVFGYISWYLFIDNQQVFAFVHWFYTISDINDLCAQRPAQKKNW